MRVIIAFLFAAVQFATAAPPAPAPEVVAEWITFSKPVTLESREIQRGDFHRWGKPTWVTSYQTKKQSLVSYVIAVYERGTYLAENRSKLEEMVSKRAKEVEGTDESKHFRVETRPDGRKVFFHVMGFGPGGALLEGFTSLADCDLVVVEMFNHEDDTPDNERLKEPAMPTKELGAVFQKVEQYLQISK